MKNRKMLFIFTYVCAISIAFGALNMAPLKNLQNIGAIYGLATAPTTPTNASISSYQWHPPAPANPPSTAVNGVAWGAIGGTIGAGIGAAAGGIVGVFLGAPTSPGAVATGWAGAAAGAGLGLRIGSAIGGA